MQNLSLNLWKLKREIDFLEEIVLQGSTSAITLYVKPGYQINKIKQFINNEKNKADRIKSPQNRRSVLTGLGCVQEMLKKIKDAPNGFACFVIPSAVDLTSNKTKLITLVSYPPTQLQEFSYNCDGRIITGPLKDIMNEQPRIGFIIVDGSGALFATVQGRAKTILHRYNVYLRKKHNKGGQSQARFERSRVECRQNYIKKVCEKMDLFFLENNQPIITSLIIAGDAQLKDELEKSRAYHQSLLELQTHILTVAYGGDRGLEEAIKQSADFLSECALVKEITVINKFFDLINQEKHDMVTYTINHTVKALIDGFIDTLIIWEDISFTRCVTEEKCADKLVRNIEYIPSNSPLPDNTVQSHNLLDWIVDKCPEFKTDVFLISDNTREGKMLVQGFEGIAGILRYSNQVEEEDMGLLNA